MTMAFKSEHSVDPLDLDRFIDFDQTVYPSPSSSSSSSRGKAIATPEYHVPAPSAAQVARPSSSQPLLSGPRHQYGNFPQQTGLPPGALASTLLNQPLNFHLPDIHQSYRFDSAHDYLGLKSEDVFDFGSTSSNISSFAGTAEMDLDFDSPIELFSAQSMDFVDPSALTGSDDMSPDTTPVQAPVRLWPGMHQQQAALAKAQAQELQQQQVPRQRQLQRPAQVASIATQPTRSAPRPAAVSKPAADPIVEERISRLLNQMRHDSVASSVDDASTPHATPHSSRHRKEEEDMDEDERLLASEEGKKLSSKERRQLRNKVSARAFRSRRKEYIGQLEGELATKANESDDLRAENEALKAENTRLTDLTRMLLSSSAFSTFLNDLSSNSSALPSAVAPTTVPSLPSTSQAQSITQPAAAQRKDINPHQVQQSSSLSNATVGMTFIPDMAMPFSQFDSMNSSWGTGMDFAFNAQVFAVTSIPDGPIVDLDSLSGKPAAASMAVMPRGPSKDDAPVIERMPEPVAASAPVSTETEPEQDDSFDEAADSIFADAAPASPAPYALFGSIAPEKAFARLELVLDGGDESDGIVSAATMARFHSFCASLDELAASVASVTSHL